MNTQEHFIKEANKGNNIFLTGIAGGGKTYILNQWRKEQEDKGKNVIVVAPTGIAAINCGGATIHSTFKLYGDNYHVFKSQVIDWNIIDVLIIDEVSMVSCEMFDYMSEVINRKTHSSEVFGGIQVICVGDLNQLPPIYNLNEERTKDRYNKLMKELGGVYFNLSTAYKEGRFKEINLTEPKRSQDQTLNILLNRIRDGDMKAINEFKTEGYSSQFYNKAVHIFPYNNQVDNHNYTQLLKLPGKQFIFKGIIEGEFNMNNVLVPEELKLKEGAEIMIIKNLECGLVNGDMGTILKIDRDNFKITINSERLNKDIDIGLETWDNIVYDELGHKTRLGGLVHFPMKLGYALSAHKSQGCTLDKVIFHYNKYLSKELTYVALSRVRTYDNIYVIKS